MKSDSAKRRWKGSKWDGLEVQEEWHHSSGYADFCEHLGPAPPGSYLDRKDNNKGYIKGNVKWSTGIESNSNKGNNKFIEAHGLSLTIPEWSRRTGQSIGGIRYRLTRLSPDEAIKYGG